jgi:type IV pilus assembly protein PilV
MAIQRLNKSRHNGMTLLEVLVTLVILAFGLLGIAGMLMLSNKANNSSYAKQQAVQSIYNMFDKIRANYQSAINGNYNISNIGSNGLPTSITPPSALCDTSVCTSAQMAAYDTWYWLNYDVSKLPSGCGSISSALSSNGSGNTIITVTVQWDDSPAQTNLGSSSAVSSTNANLVQLSIQSQL